MKSWREIPVSKIEWSVNPISSRAGGWVDWMCSDRWKTSQWKHERDRTPQPGQRGYWCDMTLGQLADAGQRWWRRNGANIGPMAMDVIRWVIDEAAEGRCPLKPESGSPAPDAYVPKAERITE